MFSLVDCPLKASRTLMVFYIGVLLSALYALYITQIDLFPKLIAASLLLAVFISAIYTRGLLASHQSITAFTWSAEVDQFYLSLKCGERLEVNKIQGCVVTPVFVLLTLNAEKRFFSIPLLVFFDSCSVDQFRRLKVLASFASRDLEG